jgi:hypothetical protein
VTVVLSELNEDFGDIKDTIESIGQDTGSKELKLSVKAIKSDTTDSYNEIFKLLLQLEEKRDAVPYADWKPKHTGLHLVGPSDKDGSFGWVSNEGMSDFMSKGKETFKVSI